jgi:hypothetical protein
METNRNHYRKVFKSDHLGVADLEEMLEQGRKLVFTIEKVVQYNIIENNKNSGVVVAGKRISANIAYFVDKIKPMVLNATNSKIMKSFHKDKSPIVEDWNNVLVELYIDSSVKMKGQIVGGVKIRPTQPIIKKPELTPNHPRWEEAKKAIIDGKEKGVLKVYDISEFNLKLIKE